MRFKAKLTNDKLAQFSGVLSTLEKICSRCVVQISEDNIRFAGLKDSRSEDVMPYSDLNQTVRRLGHLTVRESAGRLRGLKVDSVRQ